jgi:hypothetical protein
VITHAIRKEDRFPEAKKSLLSREAFGSQQRFHFED